MTTAVQRRRGTNTEHASFTGLEGELSVNTTNESVHVHDGSTAGGFELARADASNIVATSIDINGGTIDGTAIGASSASTGAFTTLTASGLDVTGTATMDGLTVDGAYTDVKFKTTQGRLDLWLTDTDTTEGQVRVRGDANNLVFITNTAERMRIDSSGNVGIGTSSPDTLLNIASSSAPTIRIENTDTSLTANQTIGDIDFYQNDPSGGGVGVVGKIRSINSSSFQGEAGLAFHTGTTSGLAERMRINSSGDVKLITANDTAGTSKFLTFGTNAFNRAGIKCTNAATYDGSLEFYTGNASNFAERMRIDSSGNVSIGTSATSAPLRVNVGTDQNCAINTSGGNPRITAFNDAVTASVPLGFNGSILKFETGGSERMRIDSSGNLLVGKSSAAGQSTAGIEARGDGVLIATKAGTVQYLNRTGSDGTILNFAKDGSTVGSIGSYSNSYLYIGSGGGVDTHVGFVNGHVRPADSSGAPLDNSLDLGHSVARWDDIYATNGTIQTSDRNEKQDIAELSDAEQRVAVAAKGLLRKFRWKDSVAEKGDDARIHFGIIAQDLQAAFEAEGLDAGDYAMFISTTWTDEETNEEKTRMGVRYSELLAFIISAI